MWKRNIWKRVLSALLISVILLLSVSSIVSADSWVNISNLAADSVSSTPEHFVKTSAGVYWVSWVVQKAGGDELYVSSSADGVTWDVPVLIDTASDRMYDLGMAVQSNGYITVVYSTDYATDGLYALTYNGSSWDTPVLIDDVPIVDDITRCSVAVDSSDNIHLFYEDDSSSNNPDLYHTWGTSGSWETPELIASYTGYYIYGLDVVVSSAKVYFFWSPVVFPGGSTYSISMRTKTGTTLASTTILYTTGSGYDYLGYPSASIWTNGTDIILSFLSEFTGESYNDIAVTYSTDGGLTWAWPTYVERTPLQPPRPPSISINNKGVVTITYVTDDGTSYYATNSEGYQANVIDAGTVDWFYPIRTLDGYYPRVSGRSVCRSDTGVDIIVNDALGGYDDVLYRHVTTLSNLFVVTKAATDIGVNSATLNGELTTLIGSSYASVYFQYGMTTTYGINTAQQQLTAVGSFHQNTANSGQWQNISGDLININIGAGAALLPNTTYHYRAVASAGGVTVYGADVTFTTLSTTGASADMAIRNVKVFSSYKVAGDYLFAAEMVNNYPGLAPIERPGEYFMMRLYGTDGTTLLAASPIANWGDRPCSIYVNATIGATLTYGSAYYIKMVGVNVAGNPVASYQLLSTDWKGSDLTKLDYWCIGTAYNMQTVDNRADYVQMLNTKLVISDKAGAYFKSGLPGISSIRPGIFETIEQTVVADAGAAADIWGSPTNWETNVGTAIADDADTIGAPFGAGGQAFLGAAVLSAMLGCVMLVVSKTGGFGALGALLIAIPLLWWASFNEIIPMFVIGLICFIALIFAVRQFVIKTL
jgi:hypothetical protein